MKRRTFAKTFLALMPVFFLLASAAAGAHYAEFVGRKYKTDGEIKGVMVEDSWVMTLVEIKTGGRITALWDKTTYGILKDVLECGNTIRAVVEIADGGVFNGISAEKTGKIFDTKKDLLAGSLLAKAKLKPSDLKTMNIYEKTIKYFNPNLTTSEVKRISSSILLYSRQHNLDPKLIIAVIAVESDFNVNARSIQGAVGLGQLMPGTAKGMKVNPLVIEENIKGTTSYLRICMEQWKKYPVLKLPLALASYNAGPSAVTKYGGIPPYYETQNYVRKVMELYNKLCSK